jgi:hypothetical protein
MQHTKPTIKTITSFKNEKFYDFMEYAQVAISVMYPLPKELAPITSRLKEKVFLSCRCDTKMTVKMKLNTCIYSS